MMKYEVVVCKNEITQIKYINGELRIDEINNMITLFILGELYS